MRPRARRNLRLLAAGGAACAVGVLACAALDARSIQGGWVDAGLSVGLVLLGAGALAFAVAHLQETERSFAEAWNTFWGVELLCDVGTDWQRWPRPPRRPRPAVLDEPRDSAYWMKRLAKCYARLARLEDLCAPATIIENERKLIRKTIAELSPADALAVMRSWQQLASEHVKKARKAPPVDESN